ncbi:MAG: hypothetical protein RLZZ469_2101, partial [Bacteroidota bacterium]
MASFFYPIFTEVIVNEPPTALSLKKSMASVLSCNPKVY